MSNKEVQECIARAEAEYEWMKDKIHDQYEKIKNYKQKIDKALNKINNMFDNGNENTVIDDLLELEKILKGE